MIHLFLKIVKRHFKVAVFSLFSFSFFLLSLGFYYVFFEVPEDYLQGGYIRMLYIHAPSAWLSLFCYASLALSSSLFLIYKNFLFDTASVSLATSGVLFTALTLLTGSLWGKPVWGTWWIWDARLTSTLLLFIIYLSYLLIRNTFKNVMKKAKLSAIFALFGVLNLPVIKFSVYMWSTLHQVDSVKFGKNSIHYTMYYPLPMIFIGLVFIVFSVLLLDIKVNLLKVQCTKKL